MAQFNPESLARLLTQVEREVLVAAAETAAIDPLLSTPRGETLDELAEWFNFLGNILVLAPALRDIASERIIEEALEGRIIPVGVGGGIRNVVGFFLDLTDKIATIQATIEEEFGKKPDPDVEREDNRLEIVAHAKSIKDMMVTLGGWNVRHAKSNVLRGIAINTTWEADQIGHKA